MFHRHVLAFLYTEKTLIPVYKQGVEITCETNLLSISLHYLLIYCPKFGLGWYCEAAPLARTVSITLLMMIWRCSVRYIQVKEIARKHLLHG